ncbi:hypothetical protein V5O48_014653 [Marasmius crinis-equi]|uniref:F-box domain-containing protein n=1 Tax=Marasmius crinis-equi TaxID=585013 RepID=A0ABR3EWP1_9AGAR
MSRVPILKCKTCDQCSTHFTGVISPDVDNSLFRSLTIPTEQEMSIQNRWLESDEQLLVNADNKVAFLEAVLRKMNVGRAILGTRISRRRSLKGTIRRLPVEILRIIFQLASSDVELDWRDRPGYPVDLFSDEGRNVPGTVAQVCHLWKEVVYGTPELWTRLSVMVPRTPSQEHLFLTILNRSGSRPLKLSVDAGPWLITRSPPPHVAVLCSALTRAEELDISFDIVGGLNLGGVQYLQLKQLRLHVHGAWDLINRYSYSRRQVEALIQAPVLESFLTDDFTELGRDGIYPRSTISVFECQGERSGGMKQAHLLELVARCPDIRSLNIVLRGSTFAQVSSQPILLPRLERLVYRYDTSDRALFLDSISTPALINLTVPGDPTEEFTSGLVRFLDRSGCRLQSLDCNLPWGFEGKDINSGWPAIFARVPDLKSLRVRLSANISWDGRDPLGDLCSILNDPSWAKGLSCLHVRATAGGWRDLEREEMEDITRRFLDLVESRAPRLHVATVAPLREAQLHLDCVHQSGWGEVASIPLAGVLEQRRLLLQSSGMVCDVFFPAI